MFNVGREFNKFASTQGAGFFGALPRANQSKEMRFAGNALNNITRYKSALEGIESAEREASRNRSAARTNAILGSIGNVVGSGLSAGIKHGFNFGGGVGGDFSADDAVTMGMPSGQADAMSQGADIYWDTDMPTNSWLNMGSGGGNAQGQNPYSINTTGW